MDQYTYQRTYQREIDQTEAAKINSEHAAVFLALPIQRILDRIEHAFPKKGNGKPGREMQDFSPNKLLRFLNDTANDLSEATTQFSIINNAYGNIPVVDYHENERPKATERFLLHAAYEGKFFALYTPVVVRTSKVRIINSSYLSEVCWRALQNIPYELFSDTKQLQEYLISVYPVGTSETEVIDLDNIDKKTFGDILFAKFGKDDNAVQLPTMVSYSIFTNEIKPGLYTVLTPETESIMSRKTITKHLKKWFKNGS